MYAYRLRSAAVCEPLYRREQARNPTLPPTFHAGRAGALAAPVGAGRKGERTMSDTAADRWPEAADRKRVRTAWRLRHRCRRAQRLASVAGAALAIAIVAMVVTRLPDRAAALDRGF